MIRVEARADNPQAVDFYKKQGYRHLGSVSGYYRGTMDAARLEKMLCSRGP